MDNEHPALDLNLLLPSSIHMNRRKLPFASASHRFIGAFLVGILLFVNLTGQAHGDADAAPHTTELGTVIYAYDYLRERLVSFDASNPTVYLTDIPLTFPAAETAGDTNYLIGIDFRPTNGLLYGVMTAGFPSKAQVVVIGLTDGVVTPVNPSAPYYSLADPYNGFEFDPSGSFARSNGTSRGNRRLNADSGASIAADTALSYGTGDTNFGLMPSVVHTAYDHPTTGGATLYGIDANTNTLVRIGGLSGSPSANTGVVTTVGSLGVNPASSGGFDIQQGTNLAYAALRISEVATLVRIDLESGLATIIGPIGDGEGLIDGLSIPILWPSAPGSGTVPGTPRDRTLRAINTHGFAGGFVDVPIEFVSTGGESGLDISLGFLATTMTFDSVSVQGGALPATQATVNDTQLGQGRLGISLRSLGTFAPGTYRVASVRFRLMPNPTAASVPVAFSRFPLLSTAYDPAGMALETRFANAVVHISPADRRVHGRVTAPSGIGIAGAVVTITDSTGFVRSIRTNSFGNYEIWFTPNNVAPHVLNAASTRYRFEPKIISTLGESNSVNLTGTAVVN